MIARNGSRARRRPNLFLASGTAVVEDGRLAALAQAILTARGEREAHFPSKLFGEPAWDLLLALYVAHASRHVIPVGAVATVAGLAPTLALRTVALLERDKWLDRRADPAGGATTVALTERAVERVEAWLGDHFHLAAAPIAG